VSKLNLEVLPARWYETRDESLRRFGDEWVHSSGSVALLVPSAAIRIEWNVLINPDHPDFSRIKFQKPELFEFDVRMFR
jgi:RES domain-containing protein